MNELLPEQMLATLFRLKRVWISTAPHMGLPPGEGYALMHIKQFYAPGNAGNLFSDLHARMFLSKPAVSQILNSLERKGLITRAIDPADRRRIHIRLTEKAERLVRDIHTSVDSRMALLLDKFGQEDARAFIALGNRFIDLAEETAGHHPEIKQDG